MTTTTVTAPATRWALYYRPLSRRRRPWTLHAVFGSEREAQDRVRELPFKSLDYWITTIPAGSEVGTELTDPKLKNFKTKPATTPSLF